MKITWRQISLLSSKHDIEELKYFRAIQNAEKNRKKVKTLVVVYKELHFNQQSIQSQRRRRPFFFHRHLLCLPRPGLQLVAQAIAYCVRATAAAKLLEKQVMKASLRAARKYASRTSEARESMLEMVEAYNGNIIFKLMGMYDISALKKVRDALPHKVLFFSVGATMAASTMEGMEASTEAMGLDGLCTSALFELRGGVFRRLREAEARARGFVFTGIYGRTRI